MDAAFGSQPSPSLKWTFTAAHPPSMNLTYTVGPASKSMVILFSSDAVTTPDSLGWELAFVTVTPLPTNEFTGLAGALYCTA